MDIITASSLVAVLWGGAPHVHKRVSAGFDPRDFVILSGVCYSIMIFSLWITRKDFIGKTMISLDHLQYIFLFTLIFVFTPNIVYLWALKKSPSIDRVIAITCISPLFTVLFGRCIYGTKLTCGKVVGGVLLVLGATLLSCSSLVY